MPRLASKSKPKVSGSKTTKEGNIPCLGKLSFDTETTGVDFHHGARPFFVTTCDESGANQFWEWDVDPLTREPQIPEEDLDEIGELLSPNQTGELVLHNTKFDVTAMASIRKEFGEYWHWDVTKDTLLAGHLLASNHAKDLTSMAVEYLGIDILPYEDKLEDAVKKARNLCRRKAFIEEYGEWAIAEEGRPDMPSAGGKTWKYDSWLPRSIASRLGYTKGECEVVNLRTQDYDVRIDRSSKWGNPFSHLTKSGAKYKVASPEEAINRYREWIKTQPKLLEALPELEGQRLGCFCKPDDCHGDVLKELAAKLRHPWWNVLKDYANVDSLLTLKLWEVLETRLKQRNLWAIYNTRLKILPIAYKMETSGVTLSKQRLMELTDKYKSEAKESADKCVGIAAGYDFDLTLPKGGVNNSLREFIFDKLKLPPFYSKKSKTGNPSLDKNALETYGATLPDRSKGLTFVRNLRGKRSRDTMVSYMTSYQKFWRPWVPAKYANVNLLNGQRRILDSIADWFVLHPSLNPTGTDTIRWSSSNPNEQNISKQGMLCVQCGGPGCRACNDEGIDPRSVRYTFGPAPDREWWSMDCKNIELRIPAYVSGEEAFIELFERPDDPPYFGSNHLLISHILHPEKFEECINDRGILDGRLFKKKYASTLYQRVKNGNFALLYGAVDRPDGLGTADKTYGIPGAQARIKQRFSKQEALNQSCIAYAEKHGYIETLPDKTVDPERGYPLLCTRSEYGRIKPTIPLNYLSQGTAVHIINMAMIRCQEQLDEWNASGFDGFMTLQVHDELVFDFPKAAHPKKNPKRSNLWRAQRLQKLMEVGGDNLVPRVPTPVSIEYHEISWNEGVSCG